MAARKGKQKGARKDKKGASKGAKRARSLSSRARSVLSGASFKKRSAASRKGWETRRALQKKRSEAARKGWVTRRQRAEARAEQQRQREERFANQAYRMQLRLLTELEETPDRVTPSQHLRMRMAEHSGSITELDTEIQTMTDEGLGSARELYTLFYSPDAS